MSGYILRRLSVAVIVVIGITLVTFVMLQVISPAPGRVVLGLRASPAAVYSWDKIHGFTRPLIMQYLTYLNHLIHGNLGESYSLNQSVNAILGEYAPRSALLSGVSLVLAIAIAMPLGIFQAVRRNKISDYVLTTTAFVTYSMPVFFLGLILIELFSLKLNWLPAEASQATTVIGVIRDWKSMILPVATLTLVSVASYSRFMRSSALDNLAQDYIKVARAKGLSQRAVLTRHLVRNSCLPMVTLIGLSIPALLAGNLITENLFNYQGLGVLFVNALNRQDYPVLLAYTLIGGVLTVVGNLIADIALTVADPRIRLA